MNSKKDTFQPIFRRFPRLTLVLVNGLVLFLLCLVAEIYLRSHGTVPGFTGGTAGEFVGLTLVDSLVVEDVMTTDSNGIFKGNVAQYDALWGEPLNQEGFRGREFDTTDTSVARLLLIGDSFVWGGNASPLSESFPDILDREGYAVFNAGMSGTEPNQYLKIAQQYLPLLHPDQVCVFFYMGNDILYEKIELLPYQPKYFITNAGWLNAYADPAHPFKTAKAAYDFYYKWLTIPATDRDPLNWLFAQTSTTTQVWRLLRKVELIPTPWHPDVVAQVKRMESIKSNAPVSSFYLQQIQDLCKAEDIPFKLFVIPLHTELGTSIEDKYPGLFGNLEYLIPDNLARSDYHEWPDGHLNNQGHRKYADFVKQQLASTP